MEIREAAPVLPEKTLKVLNDVGRPGVLVNTTADLYLYLHLGGYGVVEESLSENHLPDIVEPSEVVRSNSQGLISIESVPDQWLRRAPTRKKRVEILKRDNLRCRICGRSPHDYVDVELHVHHVKPWGKGGLTEEDNLISICKTCHDGLDPHYDPELFGKLGWDPYKFIGEAESGYKERVTRYRKRIVELMSESEHGDQSGMGK